jgi:hypothetical protein
MLSAKEDAQHVVANFHLIAMREEPKVAMQIGSNSRSRIDTRCIEKKLLTIFPLFVRFFLDTCEA